MSESVAPISIRRTEDRFRAGDRRMLFRRSWTPPAPRRQVVIVHGFGEHSGRYAEFGSWLAERGCAVHAYDHQGHGQSSGARGHAPSFDALLDDLEAFMALTRDAEPGLPRVLLGHSMGGLITAAFTCERQPEIDLLVTSGAMLALSPGVSRVKLVLARLLGRLAPRLGMNAGLDPNAISTDPEVVARYVDDPLVHGRVTAAMGSGMFAAVSRTAASPALVHVPMLVLHGEADRLCPPAGSAAFYAGLPQARVAGSGLRTYPNLKHEILNEPTRASIYQDILDWVEAREAERSSAAAVGPESEGGRSTWETS